MIKIGQKYSKRGFIFKVVSMTEKSVKLSFEVFVDGFDGVYMKPKHGIVSKQHLLDFFQLES